MESSRQKCPRPNPVIADSSFDNTPINETAYEDLDPPQSPDVDQEGDRRLSINNETPQRDFSTIQYFDPLQDFDPLRDLPFHPGHELQYIQTTKDPDNNDMIHVHSNGTTKETLAIAGHVHAVPQGSTCAVSSALGNTSFPQAVY